MAASLESTPFLSTARWARGRRLVRRVVHALRVMHERRQLLRLDERALKDIGLTASQARFEAMRPLWDLPELRRHDR